MKMLRFNLSLSVMFAGFFIGHFSGILWAAEFDEILSSEMPLCYFQSPEGATINLSDWCGETPSRSPSRPSCSEGMNPENISISEVEYDGKKLRGTVVNQTCNTLRNVKVNYQVLDGQNNIIDNGFITVNPVILEPGATASFEGEVTEGATVRTTHVDWM